MNPKIFPGWWQVVVAFLLQAVSASSVFLCYSIIAVPIKTSFDPSTMVLMLGVTVAVVSGGVLSPILGAAIDRFSIRALMLTGSVCLASGFLLLSVTTAMWQVLLVYLLPMSVGNLLLGTLSITALITRWFTKRRGFALSVAISGVAIGGILVPPFLQLLMDTFEWRVALRVFAGMIFLFTAPFITLLVIDRPADVNMHADGHEKPQHSDMDSAPRSNEKLTQSFTFWILILAIGATFLGPFALLSNMVQFATSNGFDAARGAILLSIYSGASFAGKLLFAGIADRIADRFALIGILLMLAASMLGFILANSYAILVVAVVFTGLSAGAMLPFRSVLVANLYGPWRVGRVLGLVSLLTMPFTFIGPPLFGWSFDVTGNYDAVLIGYLALLVVVTLLISRTRFVRYQEPVQD